MKDLEFIRYLINMIDQNAPKNSSDNDDSSEE